MRRPLSDLPPGTRFRLPALELTGTLLMVNECRALVRIDQPEQLVEFTNPDGSTRTFRAIRKQETSWAPTVVVEPLFVEPEVFSREGDDTMPTKKSTKSKASPAAKGRRKATIRRDGSMSQLDAAVKVLGDTAKPMTTKEMIDAMTAKGYWASPAGKTPAQTLYSAILRELQKQGDAARFVKVERDQFALRGASTASAKSPAKGKRTKGAKSPQEMIPEGAPGPNAVAELFKI